MSVLSKWKLLGQCSALGMIRNTAKVCRTIFYAADEAIRDMSTEITPEHLLLGLFRADDSIRTSLVMPAIDSMRRELATNRRHQRQSALVLSRAAKRAIVFAAEEREHLSHKHTGTEHLFLGIIRAGSHAATVLQQWGITRDRVRQMLRHHKVVQSSNRQTLSRFVFNPQFDENRPKNPRFGHFEGYGDVTSTTNPASPSH